MARFNQLVQPGISSPPQRGRPIDLVHLARQTMGDSGLEYEVLRMFDHICGTYFARLKLAGNAVDLCKNLASLKGAANGVGAWTIADLATNIEGQIKSGAPMNPEWIDDLGMAVHETSAFIADMLRHEPV